MSAEIFARSVLTIDCGMIYFLSSNVAQLEVKFEKEVKDPSDFQ